MIFIILGFAFDVAYFFQLLRFSLRSLGVALSLLSVGRGVEQACHMLFLTRGDFGKV
jgi:hypothetical protein